MTLQFKAPARMDQGVGLRDLVAGDQQRPKSIRRSESSNPTIEMLAGTRALGHEGAAILIIGSRITWLRTPMRQGHPLNAIQIDGRETE